MHLNGNEGYDLIYLAKPLQMYLKWKHSRKKYTVQSHCHHTGSCKIRLLPPSRLLSFFQFVLTHKNNLWKFRERERERERERANKHAYFFNISYHTSQKNWRKKGWWQTSVSSKFNVKWLLTDVCQRPFHEKKMDLSKLPGWNLWNLSDDSLMLYSRLRGPFSCTYKSHESSIRWLT